VAPPVAHDGYGRVAKRLVVMVVTGIGLFAILALLSAAIAVWFLDDKADFARLDLENLRAAFSAYRGKTNSWPDESRWAQQLVETRVLRREPRDPWGRSFRYSLVPADGGELVPRIFSLGRDGVEGTDDDITEPQ
jgi:hypothetical protein